MKLHLKITMRIFRIACFLLILTLLFAEVSDLLVRKSLTQPWDMSVKIGGFYNEPKNSFDVMYFGSSHMYCSIDPKMVEEQTGLHSYVLATQEQPIWISYYYMKEALKTQSPKAVVLEVNMMTEKKKFPKEGTLYSAMDPIPLSKNKLDMVFASAPNGERRNYIFNIMKYHDRWEELTLEDYKREYQKKCDPYQGFVRLEQITPIESREDISNVIETREPLSKTMQYLEKIYELTNKEGITLIFLKTPSNATRKEQMLYNAAWKFAEEHDIAYIDYNQKYEELGLKLNEDFYDRRHLNFRGVQKLTPSFSAYLLQQIS
ncbi:hypothetical protein [Sinanaerobacter sp. ZZT-01]|uniref:hypothetical protein n=1 Tax=Sinanaerobacter sp. ZZT-01 TaxID=3111540 RepID=UPI002D79BB42|nr:hypothetical protein [Sinanaerobacter sp. ZZT-01]WRR94894.1 hypothetical protein U5921_07180 [Sinanaerobacter sp. ZZT-01]